METGDVILAEENPRLAAVWSELTLRTRRKCLPCPHAISEHGTESDEKNAAKQAMAYSIYKSQHGKRSKTL